jgi:hypothetical protein
MNFGFGLCNDFSLAKKTPLKYESIFFGPYYLMSYRLANYVFYEMWSFRDIEMICYNVSMYNM